MNSDDRAAPKVGNHNSARTWIPPEHYRRGEPSKLQVAEEEALRAIIDLGGGPLTTNEVTTHLYGEEYSSHERRHAAAAINRLKNKGKLERVDQVPSEIVSGGFEARYAVVDMPARTAQAPEPEPEPRPDPPDPLTQQEPGAPALTPAPAVEAELIETRSRDLTICTQDQVLQIVQTEGRPLTVNDIAETAFGTSYSPRQRKLVSNAIVRLKHRGLLDATGNMIPHGNSRIMTYFSTSDPAKTAAVPEAADIKDAILDVLRTADQPIIAGTIGLAIGLGAKSVGLHLASMQRQGLVRRFDRARWEAEPVPDDLPSATDREPLTAQGLVTTQDLVAQVLSRAGPLKSAQIFEQIVGVGATDKERRRVENGITRALKRGLIKVVAEESAHDGRFKIKTYAAAGHQTPAAEEPIGVDPPARFTDADFPEVGEDYEEHLQAELALADLRARFKPPLEIDPLPNMERALIQLRGVVEITRNLGCAKILPDDLARLADWAESVNEHLQRRGQNGG